MVWIYDRWTSVGWYLDPSTIRGREINACSKRGQLEGYSLILPFYPSPKIPGEAGEKVRERYDVGQDGKTEECRHHLMEPSSS